MTVSEFPKEILMILQQRVEEQGNMFDVSLFDSFPLVDKEGGGFHWSDSPEEHHFWSKILQDKNFDEFYEKYPKPEDNTYTYVPDPKDVKEGDKFIVVHNRSFDGGEDSFIIKYVGQIITLFYNDGTKCPMFRFPNGERHYIYWSCLAPYQDIVMPVVDPENSIFPFNVGDEVEVVSLISPNGTNWISAGTAKIGDIFTITEIDIRPTGAALLNDNKFRVNWFTNMLRKTDKSSQSKIQYTDGKSINSTSNQTIESPRILPTVVHGSAYGRTICCSARNPVKLGC